MAQLGPASAAHARRSIAHVRAPRPIHFPEYDPVSEGKRHLELRTFLYQLVKHILGPAHSVGSDQFVYWNARDARRKLSPDVFVCRDVPDEPFGSWKIWEKRTPELGVEIVSPSEGADEDWNDELERYHECGIVEVVRFNPEAPEGARLRVWDRIDDDLVEREIEADRTPCLALGLEFVVAPIEGFAVALRLADKAGAIVPSAFEQAHADKEHERAEKEHERAEKERERARAEAAEARIAEFEAAMRAQPKHDSRG